MNLYEEKLIKHLSNRYRVFIEGERFLLKAPGIDKTDLAGKTGMEAETLQYVLDKMYDAGRIIKDDGQTVWFKPSWIISLPKPTYF